MLKNIILFILLLAVSLSFLLLAGVLTGGYSENWERAARAAGGYPYQIGLMDINIIPCKTIGTPPQCVGGELCNVRAPGVCALYSEVIGTPAGGMGDRALFLDSAMAVAGVAPGGELIAGGMFMTEMDNGVLSGNKGKGCYNCAGITDKTDVNWWNKYIIALFRDFIKPDTVVDLPKLGKG